MRRWIAAIVVAAALATARPAAAWEAETTHAGLTERAGLSSKLHQRLRRQFGVAFGLLGRLIIPPADAPELFALLRRYNPVHGYVPDTRGRLGALGWLIAGAVVADQPAAHWANHFLDPATGKGLDDRSVRGLGNRLSGAIEERRSRQVIPHAGMAATAWLASPDNPMNLDGFAEQYARAVSGRTPAERARALAGALLAAGAILHVLEDMGSPSHVRDDLAAHLENLANNRVELGSRYERVAALAYGRLGVPSPGRELVRLDTRETGVAGYLTALADDTSRRWFSAGTLPASIQVPRRYRSSELAALLGKAVRRPEPVPPPTLDLVAAARVGGQTLRDASGTCLARYQVVSGRLQFTLDDRCVVEQLAVVLPEVGERATELLDYLFRGELAIRDGAVSAVGVGLGAGTLEVYAEDSAGTRTSLSRVEIKAVAAGQPAARLDVPAGARRVAALFRGVDAAGQPLVASGLLDLTPAP